MILSTASPALAPGGGLLLVAVALLLYVSAALPALALRRFSAAALVGAWVLHGVLLVIDIAGVGLAAPGARLGFGPVLSMTVWLVVAVYAVESRLVPLPAVRQWLAVAGLLAVLLAASFPGELRPIASRLAPLHFALGAQYRELAAFAQFASDLDEATRKQLERGRLVTELMKQVQYAPLSVSEMAVSLYAANGGYIDDVPVNKVLAFESALHAFLKSKYKSLMDNIESTQDLSKDDDKALAAAIQDFKATAVY